MNTLETIGFIVLVTSGFVSGLILVVVVARDLIRQAREEREMRAFDEHLVERARGGRRLYG